MTCVPPKTPEERAIMKARLTRLEAFYDEIVTGKAVKRFEDQNGEKIEYSTANITKLETIINELRACLDASFARYYRARPVGFIFPRQ
jgi:hypothetical protein